MSVVDRLAQRQANWRELDQLLRQLARPGGERSRRGATTTSPGPESGTAPTPEPKSRAELILRLGELYRAACADLMLAEAHDLPRDTVAYLHDLVARAHNAVYRAQGFKFTRWAGELLRNVPRRLRAEPMLRVSALVFYGTFLAFGLIGAGQPETARDLVGEASLETFEQMYSEPVWSREGHSDSASTGFYIQHNASIGLQCYAFGLAFGLGTLFILLSNALQIGVVFGHMATTPHAINFYTFVTTHAPFELTAIVFSGAAGLRLGYSLIDTEGYSRVVSLRLAAQRTLPTMGAAVFLFTLAAFLEGCVSPSPLPYPFKAAIAMTCATLLVAYLVLGGRERRADPGAEEGA